MSYPINENLIPDLPKEPYDGGVGAYVGVVAHATAVYGDSDISERNYEVGHWQDAFVHFFVDHTGIEQVADYNYVCYGSGHTANHKGYAQVELCQTQDPTQFTAAYGAYVWLLAYLLYRKGLPVVDGDTLMSHAQVSVKWKETDHTDPCGQDGKSGYLGSHGKTWADVVKDVTNCYNSMKQPTKVESPAKTTELYRVRASWQDAKSQVGAFRILQSAITTANLHPGTKVFNEAGQQVYPAVVSKQPTPAPEAKPVPEYRLVATGYLPLRCHRDPNIKAPIVGEFPKGTHVQVFGKTTTGWWEVGANGIRGWVAGEYLK